MHRSGFVNIIGNPNVGKSTLMNALVGERLSIITSKAQTTRHRIMGIVDGEDFQIVYSDTPGILKPAYKLQESMMNFVRGDVERLARMGPHEKVQPGLIPRFMPLRTIPEKECLLYALVSGMEFWDGVCPYWQEALRNQYRDVVDSLEDRTPGVKFSILSSFDTLRPMLHREYTQSELHPCPRCGEPTVGRSCKSCQLLDRAISEIRRE